ncbi:cytochrome-c peroxidase [Paraglaciecola sp.]|uniref:cytochrome-c peroxidase n=1 Tax=Paraglaciecola sp. TaxID=1920173 RepID=UPI003EF4A6FF
MQKFIVTFFLLINCSFVFGNIPDKDKLRNVYGHFFKPLQAEGDVKKQQLDKILLGKTLFYDPRLSKGGEYSCNGCHDLDNYGSNGQTFLQLKINGLTNRDVPSIYNKAGLTLYGWTGQFKTLSAYIEHALTHPDEMANQDITLVLNKINQLQAYQALSNKAFNVTHLSKQQLIEALVSFINGLVTPAPIDAFMAGDDNALTPEQITGGLLFDRQYCHSCHTGTNFGGRMIQKTGVKETWPNQKDMGLYHDTQRTSHKMFFRVSTLRNIEKTAPYFHDGSSKRMWDAAKKMARYELGREMPLNDALAIQAFFQSLTGDIPRDYIKKPSIPK